MSTGQLFYGPCGSNSFVRLLAGRVGQLLNLSSLASRPSAKAGVSSGVRRGYEFNVNRAGNDIDVIRFEGDEKPWNCQAACARSSQCRSWSMALGFFTSRCILKDGIPAGASMTNMVSGRKGMEFF